MDNILELAKPYQWNGGLVEGWTFNTKEHLQEFIAAAISEATKQKDGQLAESEKSRKQYFQEMCEVIEKNDKLVEQLAATELVVEQMREALKDARAVIPSTLSAFNTVEAALKLQPSLSTLKADREQSEQRGRDALMKELREQKPNELEKFIKNVRENNSDTWTEFGRNVFIKKDATNGETK